MRTRHVFFLIVATVALGPSQLFGAQTTPAAAASFAALPQSQSTDLQSVQAQVLESSRKFAEQSIKQIQDTSKQAIEAAQASNDHIKTIFGWASIIITGVIGLGVFLGVKTLKDVKAEVTESLQEKFDAALRKKVNQHILDLAKSTRLCTLLGIEITGATILGERIARAGDNLPDAEKAAEKKKVAAAESEQLFRYLGKIISYATTLKVDRIHGWALAQRAVLHYHVGKYDDALQAVQLALQIETAREKDSSCDFPGSHRTNWPVCTDLLSSKSRWVMTLIRASGFSCGN